jgi:hypothetical protein
MIDCLLQINQQQDRAVGRICVRAYVAAGLKGANIG